VPQFVTARLRQPNGRGTSRPYRATTAGQRAVGSCGGAHGETARLLLGSWPVRRLLPEVAEDLQRREHDIVTVGVVRPRALEPDEAALPRRTGDLEAARDAHSVQVGVVAAAVDRDPTRTARRALDNPRLRMTSPDGLRPNHVLRRPDLALIEIGADRLIGRIDRDETGIRPKVRRVPGREGRLAIVRPVRRDRDHATVVHVPPALPRQVREDPDKWCRPVKTEQETAGGGVTLGDLRLVAARRREDEPVPDPAPDTGAKTSQKALTLLRKPLDCSVAEELGKDALPEIREHLVPLDKARDELVKRVLTLNDEAPPRQNCLQ